MPTRRFVDRFRPNIRLPDLRVPGFAAGGGRPDPILNGHFRVLIGETEVGVRQVSDLQLTDPKRTADGAAQTVTLTRAIDSDQTFYRWRRDAARSGDDRRRVRIHHLRQPWDETPAWTFTLLQAFPVRWTGPRFDAVWPELALEELELSYTTISWVLAKPKGDARDDEGNTT
ncbi:phage tail protein [Rhodovibrio salinarum]|nr:phage tail protein [Rhodovibrio salinarum]